MARFVGVGAGAAWLVILFISGCSGSGGAQSSAPPPKSAWLRCYSGASKTGTSSPAGCKPVETVEIRPRVSGYIDLVAFTEGKVVKRGELLFVIDPRPYKADHDRAAADREALPHHPRSRQDRAGTRAAPEGQRRRVSGRSR